jgi:hypothetical protein
MVDWLTFEAWTLNASWLWVPMRGVRNKRHRLNILVVTGNQATLGLLVILIGLLNSLPIVWIFQDNGRWAKDKKSDDATKTNKTNVHQNIWPWCDSARSCDKLQQHDTSATTINPLTADLGYNILLWYNHRTVSQFYIVIYKYKYLIRFWAIRSG